MGLLTFKGGIHPDDGKRFSKDQPIKALLPTGDLIYPLSQHIGAPAVPVVKKGDQVLKGQMIAEAGGFVSAPVYSSVSGKVKALEKHFNPTGTKVDCIVIQNDGEYKEAEYTEQWGYELAKLYYQAGEKQKCIESCDDLVLWFRQGKYVIKALELKRSLTDLTPVQQAIYDHRDEMMPIKERVEAAVPELEKFTPAIFPESPDITEPDLAATKSSFFTVEAA